VSNPPRNRRLTDQPQGEWSRWVSPAAPSRRDEPGKTERLPQNDKPLFPGHDQSRAVSGEEVWKTRNGNVAVDDQQARDVPRVSIAVEVLRMTVYSIPSRWAGRVGAKHLPRYLGAFAWRFNRRFVLKAIHERLTMAATTTPPMPYRLLKLAEDRW
jgi:hypothetical protein